MNGKYLLTLLSQLSAWAVATTYRLGRNYKKGRLDKRTVRANTQGAENKATHIAHTKPAMQQYHVLMDGLFPSTLVRDGT